MLFTTVTLAAVLPLLVNAAPASNNRLSVRENWGKEDHKDYSADHKDDHKDDKDDGWYHSSESKDWKPYYRPKSADHYKVPTWKHDKEHDYTEGKAWFRDYHVENYPSYFTSFAVAYANPDEIINNNQTAVPGLPGGFGTFAFGLNSDEDVICYNITAYITGNYSSPAVTATHIHQAAKGAAGPPRIAFPNPEAGEWNEESEDGLETRYSYGCKKGPFTTGVLANGTDTGSGFTIARLEQDPTAFFADTHTAEYVAGAIRGQIRVVKPEWEYKEEKHDDTWDEEKKDGQH